MQAVYFFIEDCHAIARNDAGGISIGIDLVTLDMQAVYLLSKIATLSPAMTQGGISIGIDLVTLDMQAVYFTIEDCHAIARNDALEGNTESTKSPFAMQTGSNILSG